MDGGIEASLESVEQVEASGDEDVVPAAILWRNYSEGELRDELRAGGGGGVT